MKQRLYSRSHSGSKAKPTIGVHKKHLAPFTSELQSQVQLQEPSLTNQQTFSVNIDSKYFRHWVSNDHWWKRVNYVCCNESSYRLSANEQMCLFSSHVFFAQTVGHILVSTFALEGCPVVSIWSIYFYSCIFLPCSPRPITLFVTHLLLSPSTIASLLIQTPVFEIVKRLGHDLFTYVPIIHPTMCGLSLSICSDVQMKSSAFDLDKVTENNAILRKNTVSTQEAVLHARGTAGLGVRNVAFNFFSIDILPKKPGYIFLSELFSHPRHLSFRFLFWCIYRCV